MTANHRQAHSTVEAVVLSGIRAHYNTADQPILDIDRLVISQGERVALVGPSGAGKTSLLRLINGYLRPTTGSLYVKGIEINARNARRRDIRRRVGFVFQGFNLVERATVIENVLWGRLGYTNTLASLLGRFSQQDKQTAMQAIAAVDLLNQMTQRCDTLSGGQQQRVAIARVVAQEPEIILADEPVSSLDPALADEVLTLLVEVSSKRSTTLVMSLHQPALARRYARRIIGLRGGRVVWDTAATELPETAVQSLYERQIG
jgi:phosphonate transport system ATP-binding protein